MKILKAHGTGVAHCPSSNMKLASGVAPVVKLLGLGIPVGVGTDGPAGSNNDFDLMEEMNLAADLQKVSTGDPTVLPAEQAVAMATILGARVAGTRKGNRVARSRQARRPDHPAAGSPARRPALQRLFADRLCAQGLGCRRRDRERKADRARRPFAHARSGADYAKAKEYAAKVAASLEKK